MKQITTYPVIKSSGKPIVVLFALALFALSGFAQNKCDVQFAAISSPTYPDSIHFYPTVNNSTSKYHWSFGDGNYSTQFSPWHNYAPGNYNVCLTVSDSTPGMTPCSATWCDSVHILKSSPPPVCNAQFQHYSATNPDSIHFYQSNTSSMAKFTWTFGDGQGSGDPNPWHFYTDTGRFTICLIVTDSTIGGSCRDYWCDTIHIAGAPMPLCNAHFQFYSLNNPDSVHFYAVTTVATTKYSWTFGDNTASHEPNPWHFYADTGTYTVCLTVTDSVPGAKPCSDTWCDTVQIRGLQKPTCNAEFQQYYSSTDPDSVHFYTILPPNTPNTIFFWSFGDGSHSTSPYPWHLYNDTGKFNVCLMVTDSTLGGKCTATWCDTIHIASLQKPPVCNAEFVHYPSSTNPDSIHFYPNANNSAKISYSWSFGDGTHSSVFNPWHLYAPGNYNACLTIYDTISNTLICTSSWCDSIHIVGPVAPVCDGHFQYYTANNPDSIHFYPSNGLTNTGAHYLWTFGDGDSSRDPNTWHFYVDTGVYTVCLTISDSTTGGKCSNTWCANVHAPGIQKPVCNAQFYHYSLAANADSVHFYTNTNVNSSTTKYLWTFGDGDSSHNQDPWHLYANPGAYYVCLTITNSNQGGACTATSCDSIHIVAPPPPVCNAQFKYYTIHNPDSVHFYPANTNIVAGTQYLWTFGDGDSSHDQYPWHFYADTGTYNVCLTVSISTQNGQCSNTWCYNIHLVLPPPPPCNAHFTHAPANSLNTIINFTSATNPPGTTYLWNFGDNSAPSYYPNSTHSYSNPGTYWVCLSVRDSTNAGICENTWCDSVHIGITPLPCSAQFSYRYASTLNTLYFIHTPNAPDVKYVWNFGDGSSSSDANVMHQFPNPGAYWVCLTVSDSIGTCSKTWCDSVYVIGGNQGGICNSNFYFKPGNSVHSLYFVSSTNPPSTKYLWTFGDGDSSTSPDPFHQYAVAGTYHVCLTVTDTIALCSDTRCLTLGPLRMASGGSTLDGQGANATASIYPNPLTESAILHIENTSGAVTFRMFDNVGRLVNTMCNLTNGDYEFSKQGLGAGIYLYEVIDNNNNISRGKLIIE